MAHNSDLFADAQTISLPAGTVVFRPGGACEMFYLIKSGRVRVDLMSLSGRSLLLYEIDAGETCVMTTACLLSGEVYTAQAIAETTVSALALPKPVFQTRLAQSEAFRAMVFRSFAERLANIMQRLDEIAFQPIDARLARRLLSLADGSGQDIQVTHDHLALDLGSAREVISRRLAAWEATGLIARARGQITLLHPERLRQIARDGD